VIAAAAVVALTAPSAFAMEKMDGDAWLKAIFHGKPGTMMAMPAMPTMPKGKMEMGKMDMGKWTWPWKWPMASK
jgi:hypothetical protein